MTVDLPLQARADLEDVYRYCVMNENGKVFFGIPRDTMRAIIERRAMSNRLVFHRDKATKEIDGVLMWHRLQSGWKLNDLDNWKDDDEKGDEIFISATIFDNPVVRKVACMRMIATEPDVVWLKISALRHKGGRLKPEKVKYSQRHLAKLLK